MFGFVVGVDYWYFDVIVIVNFIFMSGLLLVLVGFVFVFSYWCVGYDVLVIVYYLWGLLWWFGSVSYEIVCFVVYDSCLDVLLVVVVVIVWGVVEVYWCGLVCVLVLIMLVMLLVVFLLVLW